MIGQSSELRHRNGGWSATVLPGNGARVVSLRDPGGNEWLANSGLRRPLIAPKFWANGDCGGWDECFPNIAPGLHPDTNAVLHDHGDLWMRPTQWRHHGHTFTSLIDGLAAPFTFRRSLRVFPDRVTARYDVTNTGPEAFRSSWAMHLLIDAPPTAVLLDPTTPVRVDSQFGSCAIRSDTEWMSWEHCRQQLPTASADWACKLYTKPGAVESVSVTRGANAFSVSFAGALPGLPVFGLWLNAGGWPSDAPLHHLGIEPGFGDRDNLIDAVEHGSALTIMPAQTLTWSISFTLDPQGSTS